MLFAKAKRSRKLPGPHLEALGLDRVRQIARTDMASSSQAMDAASTLLAANSTDWSLLPTLTEPAIRALIRAVEVASASDNSIILLEPQRNVRRVPPAPERAPPAPPALQRQVGGRPVAVCTREWVRAQTPLPREPSSTTRC